MEFEVNVGVCFRFTPTVLGTGPKPCKAYSAIVLKQGRILVIKKGSASDDSIWFLEVSNSVVSIHFCSRSHMFDGIHVGG